MTFAKGESAYEQLEQDFQAFHWLDLNKAVFDKAVEMGHRLRASGMTVPASDLIIAASTILTDAKLYHLDHHFDLIAERIKLNHQSFNTQ